eukprot:Sspe_Gene.15019::Locus_5206_Transcript_1_1_Confidence_1.000_Length_1039::g.15019::m.15019
MVIPTEPAGRGGGLSGVAISPPRPRDDGTATQQLSERVGELARILRTSSAAREKPPSRRADVAYWRPSDATARPISPPKREGGSARPPQDRLGLIPASLRGLITASTTPPEHGTFREELSGVEAAIERLRRSALGADEVNPLPEKTAHPVSDNQDEVAHPTPAGRNAGHPAEVRPQLSEGPAGTPSTKDIGSRWFKDWERSGEKHSSSAPRRDEGGERRSRWGLPSKKEIRAESPRQTVVVVPSSIPPPPPPPLPPRSASQSPSPRLRRLVAPPTYTDIARRRVEYVSGSPDSGYSPRRGGSASPHSTQSAPASPRPTPSSP